jgi:maleate isomerase
MIQGAGVMDANLRRIGVIVPTANGTTEDELYRYCPGNVRAHIARLFRSGFDLNPDTLQELIASTDDAARQIQRVDPEVILWACTSGSFIRGPGGETAISDRITELTGIPAITTSTALVEALNAVRARKVYLVTPYIDTINVSEVAFFEAAGFDVTHTASFQLSDTRAIRTMPSEEVARLVLDESTRAGSFDAVFISCTQLHSMNCLERLEDSLGVAVISSNSATLWAGLNAIGVDPGDLHAGRLFGTTTGGEIEATPA